MSSSSKFPSGLNNWAGTDKPTRADFVADNEILDENALWKADYDPDGGVAQAGGVTAYALAKADYDPNGTVATAGGISGFALDKASYDSSGAIAQMGGIAAAIAANNGFSTYVHSKSGSVHSLTMANGGDNIKFISTADYANGDTFEVNGTACTAQMADGSSLPDDAFVSGAVVTCFRSGTVLNFKLGGVVLNFVVMGGLTQPTSPSNNTIWVQTDTAISGYCFSPNIPASPVEGLAWIQTATDGSVVEFNALKRDAIILHIIGTKQYINNAWVTKNGMIYLDNQWRDWIYYVYNHGAISYGLSLKTGTSVGTFGSIYFDTEAIRFGCGRQFSTSFAAAYTTDQMNFDYINTIKVDFDELSVGYYGDVGVGSGGIQIYVSDSPNTSTGCQPTGTIFASIDEELTIGSVSSVVVKKTEGTVSLDVSNVAGKNYLIVVVRGYYVNGFSGRITSIRG